MARSTASDDGHPGTVLIYGESANDTTAIRILAEALRPDLANCFRARRTPSIEIKNARLQDLPKRADRLAKFINFEAKSRRIRGVLAHEDCDAIEPAHIALAKKIEDGLSSVGPPVYAVTPAWETEAWWFLWPVAVVHAFPSWRAPDQQTGKRVGRITNAKQAFERAVTPAHMKKQERDRFRGYVESDSKAIATAVVSLGVLGDPQAVSDSFESFRLKVAAL